MGQTLRRSPRSTLALGLLAVLAVPIALAVEPGTHLTGTGPLKDLWIGTTLGCQVRHANTLPGLNEFYPNVLEPGDCGTFVVVNDVLYAPDFAAHTGTLTAAIGAYTPFTPVSQTLKGTGSAFDPMRIITTVELGATGLRLTEVDVRDGGKPYYTTGLFIDNFNPPHHGPMDVRVYRAADCYLFGDDSGRGQTRPGAIVGCTDNDAFSSWGEWWVPIQGGSHYLEGHFSDVVWSQIGAHQAFTDSHDTGFLNNGAGLSWDVKSSPHTTTLAGSHRTCWARGDAMDKCLTDLQVPHPTACVDGLLRRLLPDLPGGSLSVGVACNAP